jgi:chromosome partitioning protein
MITVLGSLKGGAGKSTVAFNLAVWLAMAEQDLMVLDIDPQATLTDVVEVRDEEAFMPSISVASTEALDDSLRGFSGEVVIDVGTSDIEAMRRAIALADRVVVPAQPSQADIWSTQRFLRMVDEVADGGRRPRVYGFLNRADTHPAITETEEAAAALVAMPGIDYLKRRLYQRTLFRRSFSEGLAVFEMDPRNKGSRELIALAASLYPEVL